MTRDEFASLPAGLALSLLWDALPAGVVQSLEAEPVPRVPRSPKFDTACYQRDGVQYASEMDMRDLQWQLDRAQKPGDPKYADANAKQAKALRYWIEYRRVFPSVPWTGERNRKTVSAPPPTGKARVYDREQRAAAPTARRDERPPDFDGPDDAQRGGDDDIPF
jgi:hypothetical protein